MIKEQMTIIIKISPNYAEQPRPSFKKAAVRRVRQLIYTMNLNFIIKSKE